MAEKPPPCFYPFEMQMILDLLARNDRPVGQRKYDINTLRTVWIIIWMLAAIRSRATPQRLWISDLRRACDLAKSKVAEDYLFWLAARGSVQLFHWDEEWVGFQSEEGPMEMWEELEPQDPDNRGHGEYLVAHEPFEQDAAPETPWHTSKEEFRIQLPRLACHLLLGEDKNAVRKYDDLLEKIRDVLAFCAMQTRRKDWHPTLQEIGARIGVTGRTSTVSKALKRLEGMELIERGRRYYDRRSGRCSHRESTVKVKTGDDAPIDSRWHSKATAALDGPAVIPRAEGA